MVDLNHSNKRRKNRWTLQLSTLLLVVAIFAILAAWFVDHQQLTGQIRPNEIKLTVVYRFTNASASLVAEELRQLYPNQIFVAEASANQLIVNDDTSCFSQIEFIILHFDRKDTDLIEPEIE